MLDRRSLLLALPVAGVAFAAYADDGEIAELERRNGGRLGVAALDTGSGNSIMHRAGERFAMCSTFKLLMSAAVLHRVDKGEEHLNRLISYGKADLFPHSPITGAHVAEGHMSVAALCEAAVTQSDNGAANLLLASLGGPAAVTSYARSLGDEVTRLDRKEPEMNIVPPGDARDTTTPAAMLGDLRKLSLEPVLSNASREKLTAWARDCQTGKDRLRAGFPPGWVAGDKTGTGFKAETNDIAIAWPPKRAPILITAYYTESPANLNTRYAVLADVARTVVRRFG